MSFSFTRPRRILAACLAALLLLYAAVGFWAVPGIVRSQLAQFCGEHWQRQPSVGHISFNPFTLALEIESFDFKDSQGAPLVSFERLLVNLDVSSLWRRGASFHEIDLDRPAGSVLVRADGSLNLGELTAPFAATPAAAPPADDAPARLFIDRFRLRGGAFDFEDRARSTPFKARLAPVNFELLDFSTVGSGASGNRYALQAQSSAGERFRWSGSFGLAPLSSRGQFELGDVRAQTLWSYLQESLGFDVAGGLVTVSGNYHFAATEPQITFDVGLAKIGVRDLEIRARGGDENWIAVKALDVLDSKLDLAKRTVDIGAVKLDEGSILARRGADGVVNLLTLADAPGASVQAVATPPAAEASEAAEAASPAAPGTPWVVNAPVIDVNALRIDIDDRFVKPAAALVLSPVTLALRGFSTAPGATLDVDAKLTLESGGSLAIAGKAAPADPSFTGKITLADLDLRALQPYVGTYTRMTLLGGSLGTQLDVEYSPTGFRVAGDVSSTGLRTVDNALREDFIKWDRLALTGIDYRSRSSSTGTAAESLRIASINARAPYIRFIIAPDQTTNVSKVLAMPGEAPGPVQTVSGIPEAPTGKQTPLAIHIGKVLVEDGSANFADFWIKPNYAVSLQQLGGSVSGLSSRKDSRAKVALTGKIDRYAPVEIAGELNLLSASLFTDIRVKFDGVELTSVTPYSGRFAGYRIEKGKLSVDVRYQVENRKLDAEQRFVVDQLTLGEKVDSPDAVNLPLRLAVALLKDRNGVIDLGLPVTGSLDDPKFRMGPIIWKAFVNLLAGVATSPFKLLGGLFGGGEEVNLIDFAPGDAALDAAASEKLAALTKALHARPQLALEVPAAYAADADLAALSAARLEEKLAALARAGAPGAPGGDAGLTDPARRFEWLVALHRVEKSGAPLPAAAAALQAQRARDRDPVALASANAELQAELRAGADTLEPALLTLAQTRARNIQDALLASGEVEPARVFMLAPGAQAASGDKIRVALSLK